MSMAHLSGEELDLVLAGEGIAPDRAAHLGACLACRRRRDELLEAIAGAALVDPGAAALERVRDAALAAWRPRSAHRARWWLAAAAALVLAAVAAVFVAPALRPAPVDTETVLREVDEVLARDPLSALADEEVLDVVVAGVANGSVPTS